MVEFYSDSHTYWVGDRKMVSVGYLIKQYEKEFESDYWACHTVFKRKFGKEYQEDFKQHYSINGRAPYAEDIFPKYISKLGAKEFLREKKLVLDEWEKEGIKANINGTKMHDFLEKKAYDDGYCINEWTNEKFVVHPVEKEFDNQSLCDNLYDLEDGCYPELLVFSLKHMVAGQADKVYIETDGDTRYVDIVDYKTNKKKNLKKYSVDRLRPPFEHMYATKMSIYTLQLSSYAFMLQMFGFKVRNLCIAHNENYEWDNLTYIPIDYHRQEAETMFNYRIGEIY